MFSKFLQRLALLFVLFGGTRDILREPLFSHIRSPLLLNAHYFLPSLTPPPPLAAKGFGHALTMYICGDNVAKAWHKLGFPLVFIISPFISKIKSESLGKRCSIFKCLLCTSVTKCFRRVYGGKGNRAKNSSFLLLNVIYFLSPSLSFPDALFAIIHAAFLYRDKDGCEFPQKNRIKE